MATKATAPAVTAATVTTIFGAQSVNLATLKPNDLVIFRTMSPVHSDDLTLDFCRPARVKSVTNDKLIVTIGNGKDERELPPMDARNFCDFNADTLAAATQLYTYKDTAITAHCKTPQAKACVLKGWLWDAGVFNRVLQPAMARAQAELPF